MATFTSNLGREAGPVLNIRVADRDYDLDAEGNLTDDPSTAATHLIRKGQEVPKEMADKYGIGKVAQEAEELEDLTVIKSVKPTANKRQGPKSNKGAK